MGQKIHDLRLDTKEPRSSSTTTSCDDQLDELGCKMAAVGKAKVAALNEPVRAFFVPDDLVTPGSSAWGLAIESCII